MYIVEKYPAIAFSHSIFGKIAPLHLSLGHVQHSHTNVARDLYSS